MSYRKDPDLEFLKNAEDNDLALLADALIYKSAEDKRNASPRFAATLQLDDKFNSNYPHNMRALWQSVAEELQKFGGHSGVNWLFRGNQGVLYREILEDVCKKQKVKGVDYSGDSTSKLEDALLERMVSDVIKRMSDAELREMVHAFREVREFKDLAKDFLLSKERVLDVVKIAFKQGGFKSYVLTLQVVNGISRSLLGRGLSFGANAAMMKYLSSFMSGPAGWAFAAITTVWGFMGPNSDATLKGTIMVAYMRKKMALGC